MRLKSALKCENEKSGAIRIGPDLHLTILENMSNFHDAKITKTGQSVAPGPAHVQTFDMTMKDSPLQIYKKIGRTLAAIPIQDQNIEYVLLNLYPRQR